MNNASANASAPSVYLAALRDVVPRLTRAVLEILRETGSDVYLAVEGAALRNGGAHNTPLSVQRQIEGRGYFLLLFTPGVGEALNQNDHPLRQEVDIAVRAGRTIVIAQVYGAVWKGTDLPSDLEDLGALPAVNIPLEFLYEGILRVQRGMKLPARTLSAEEEAEARRARAAHLAIPTPTDEMLAAEALYAGARAADGAGDIDRAVSLYDAVIAQAPDFASAYLYRGNAHLNLGMNDAARHDYDSTVRADPDDATAYNNRGLLRRSQGDLEGAQEDFDAAIRLFPDYAEAYNHRGLVRHAMGQVEAAIGDYDTAIRLQPDYAEAYNDRGLARKVAGDVQRALDDYYAALSIAPDYATAHNNRGAALYALQHSREALTAFNRALRLDPENGSAYYNRARILLDMNTEANANDTSLLVRATADLDAAFERLSPSAAMYLRRAAARRTLGNLSGALEDYDAAVRIYEDDTNHASLSEAALSGVYYQRGAVRADVGDAEGATLDYDQSIRLRPDFADAYNRRGAAKLAKGDIPGALRDYGEAIRINPALAAAYNNRGAARYAQNNVVAAIVDYGEAIRLNPEYAIAYLNRGVARADADDLAGAINDYSEAIRLNPDYANAYYNRGIARAMQDELDGAIADYDEAIRLNPQMMDAYLNRGYARAGRAVGGQVAGDDGELLAAIKDLRFYLDESGGGEDRAEIQSTLENLERRVRE